MPGRGIYIYVVMLIILYMGILFSSGILHLHTNACQFLPECTAASEAAEAALLEKRNEELQHDVSLLRMQCRCSACKFYVSNAHVWFM